MLLQAGGGFRTPAFRLKISDKTHSVGTHRSDFDAGFVQLAPVRFAFVAQNVARFFPGLVRSFPISVELITFYHDV